MFGRFQPFCTTTKGPKQKIDSQKLANRQSKMTESENYYETHYTEYLKTQPRDFVGNPWFEFAKWILTKYGNGCIEQPTEKGLEVWNAFFAEMSKKNRGPIDRLLTRANDAVQRRSAKEPEMTRNELYETYKVAEMKRLQEATAYKKHLAQAYKGLLCEENIITMDNDDILTQREWEELEEKKEKRRVWLLENKDRFITEAFDELDKQIAQRRNKHDETIRVAMDLATTWDLQIPETKKEKEALIKKLKAEWYFKDAVSGLKADALQTLLEAKIASHKVGLKERVSRLQQERAKFEQNVLFWSEFRHLSLEDIREKNASIRTTGVPVLTERTADGIRAFNSKMDIVNQKLKILEKLRQMNERGIRCMDDCKSYTDGYAMFFEFP